MLRRPPKLRQISKLLDDVKNAEDRAAAALVLDRPETAAGWYAYIGRRYAEISEIYGAISGHLGGPNVPAEA